MFLNRRRSRVHNILTRLFSSQAAIFLGGLFLLILVGFPLARNITRQYRVNLEIKELEDEIAALESQKLELDSLIGYLKSDEFVEEQARLNLNFKKPGEEVVVINEELSATATDAQAGPGPYALSGRNTLNKTAKESNSQKWWRYFFSFDR